MVRIAVCSRNGIAVDEHFGRTSCFYIYDTDRNMLRLAEMRLAKTYGNGQFDESRLLDIFARLSDCRILFAEMIGVEPRHWLEKKNLSVVVGRYGITELINIVKKLKKKEVFHE